MDEKTNKSTTIYAFEITVTNHLDTCWQDWFDGYVVNNHPSGTVTIAGVLPDQPALFGLLNKIRDLNLKIVSISIHARKEDTG